MSFITFEKLRKPRILLIDFEEQLGKQIEDHGFNVIIGSSGLNGSEYNIPKHPSEIELIFWNFNNIKEQIADLYPVSGYAGTVKILKSRTTIAKEKLRAYFSTVKFKSGFSVLFTGKEGDRFNVLPQVVMRKFGLVQRETDTIFPEDQNQYMGKFLMRFINDIDITHSIFWQDNEVGYVEFLKDEAGNAFAVYYRDEMLILPHIDKKAEAILSLLQEFLPLITPDAIFPDQAKFNWLNDDDFIYPTILNKRKIEEKLNIEYKQKLDSLENEIQIEEEENSFLTQALVSDDTDLFPDDKKLSRQVIKMLEVIGFGVTDVDTKNKEEGKSLKEDLQITDGEYFALGEVKGTEQGAKASWVKKDFGANREVYVRIHDKKPSEVSGIIIFNHERRIDPRKRKKPYESDPELIKYCIAMNISLVPIYDLYKVCIDVKTNKISKEEARKLIKIPGLFTYKLTSLSDTPEEVK